jgi:hypothetical protein
MSKPSETRIVLWILAQLKERYPDSIWERQNVVAAQAKDRFVKAGTKGQGDIGGCHAGWFVELEVKRPGEAQRPEQKVRQEEVRRAGGVYAVVHNPTEAFAIVDAL